MDSAPVTGGFFKPEEFVGSFGIQEGMSIADFGSGSGHFGILMGKLAGKNGHVYALDIMESALESIRGKAHAEGLSNIETRRANLEISGSSGLPDGSQDLALLGSILFQSQKKLEIINEAHRILKSGGKIVIIDWLKGGKQGFGPPDELRTDMSAMEQLVTQAGFSIQSKTPAGSFHYIIIGMKS